MTLLERLNDWFRWWIANPFTDQIDKTCDAMKAAKDEIAELQRLLRRCAYEATLPNSTIAAEIFRDLAASKEIPLDKIPVFVSRNVDALQSEVERLREVERRLEIYLSGIRDWSEAWQKERATNHQPAPAPAEGDV